MSRETGASALPPCAVIAVVSHYPPIADIADVSPHSFGLR